MQKSDLYLKIVLIGDPGVGKTSIINRIVTNNYEENYVTTLGMDLKTKNMLISQKQIKLNIWDTAGQEKFRSMSSMHYKGTDLVICVFDLTDRKSFDSIINDWLDEIGIYCDSRKTKILLLGNKSDYGQILVKNEEVLRNLKNLDRVYLNNLKNPENQRGDPMDDAFDFVYSEVSAKNGINILESLEFLLGYFVREKIVKRGKVERDRDFGETKLIINEQDMGRQIKNEKKCCN